MMRLASWARATEDGVNEEARKAKISRSLDGGSFDRIDAAAAALPPPPLLLLFVDLCKALTRQTWLF